MRRGPSGRSPLVSSATVGVPGPRKKDVSDSGKAHDALRQRVLAHERAAPAMVRACTKKTTEPSDREAMECEAQGKRPRAPKKRWRDVIKKDLAEAKVTAEDAVDRMKWSRLTRTADPATARD
ncbi:hypothetical protein V3C99_016338 [Haemonchus contortus]